jgi:hypothetical protein
VPAFAALQFDGRPGLAQGIAGGLGLRDRDEILRGMIDEVRMLPRPVQRANLLGLKDRHRDKGAGDLGVWQKGQQITVRAAGRPGEREQTTRIKALGPSRLRRGRR